MSKKKQRKDSKRSMWKVPKSFWRRKRKNVSVSSWSKYQNKNLFEEEKQRKVEYMRNYYLAQKKKYSLGFYEVVGNWGFLGQKFILTYKKSWDKIQITLAYKKS